MKEIEVSDKFIETMEKLGEVAGVGKDWYELGEPDEDDGDDVICGVYAKNEDDGDKVMDWLLSHCAVKTEGENNDDIDRR